MDLHASLFKYTGDYRRTEDGLYAALAGAIGMHTTPGLALFDRIRQRVRWC
jgi:hypothetical protein